MSRFYASIEGNRGPATRQGSADSGIEAHPRGWNVGVRVRGMADGDADEFHVYATSGSSGSGSERMIAVVRREPSGEVEVESKIVPALVRYPDPETRHALEMLSAAGVNDDDGEARFTRYIQHGRRATATHPDLAGGGIDFETAAVDTIASILHAVDEESGRSPSEAATFVSMFDIRVILERALRSYIGDFEDLGVDVGSALDMPEPPEHLADAWRRYQRGTDVSTYELRQLDEWRADVREEV